MKIFTNTVALEESSNDHYVMFLLSFLSQLEHHFWCSSSKQVGAQQARALIIDWIKYLTINEFYADLRASASNKYNTTCLQVAAYIGIDRVIEPRTWSASGLAIGDGYLEMNTVRDRSTIKMALLYNNRSPAQKGIKKGVRSIWDAGHVWTARGGGGERRHFQPGVDVQR